MPRTEVKLVKTTGELEPFNEPKLRRSLARSGADNEQISEVVDTVRKQLRDGMATREVFNIAHRMLRQEHRDTAARYSLQRAIQQLGPDGFPFEEFIGELWRHEGFKVRTSARLQGRFVRHEVDVVGIRGTLAKNTKRLAECKFRAQSGGKVDVKVALYVHARAADLKVTGFHEFWLITNGRFTKDALAYGTGVGMAMLAWNHPKGNGLRERVDKAGLHPVTALSSLHRKEQLVLLRKGVVLCASLLTRGGVVEELGLSARRTTALWREVEGLCEIGRTEKADKAGR
ncbi:MAG: restriction endonuclease [Planctomycetes bacterium]|nr:restriction endonuclease [Planctomycetota bacterium]